MDQSAFAITVDDRIIWPDGTITVPAESVANYLSRVSPDRLFVSEISAEIAEYNKLTDHPITVKNFSGDVDLEWNLPSEYKYIDLDEYLVGLSDRIEKDELYTARVERLATEIWLFKRLNLDDVLQVLIYVIDTMKAQNVVWGVGRGSSCSSYLLFLLGLHEVDVVRYQIDISDFIRTGE